VTPDQAAAVIALSTNHEPGTNSSTPTVSRGTMPKLC
jgi:hypothetical protein